MHQHNVWLCHANSRTNLSPAYQVDNKKGRLLEISREMGCKEKVMQ